MAEDITLSHLNHPVFQDALHLLLTIDSPHIWFIDAEVMPFTRQGTAVITTEFGIVNYAVPGLQHQGKLRYPHNKTIQSMSDELRDKKAINSKSGMFNSALVTTWMRNK